MVSAASRAVVLPQPVFWGAENRKLVRAAGPVVPRQAPRPPRAARQAGRLAVENSLEARALLGCAAGRVGALRGGNAAASHNGDVGTKLPQIETIQTVAMACQKATTVGLPAPFSKPCERTGCCGGVRTSTRVQRISIALQLELYVCGLRQNSRTGLLLPHTKH